MARKKPLRKPKVLLSRKRVVATKSPGVKTPRSRIYDSPKETPAKIDQNPRRTRNSNLGISQVVPAEENSRPRRVSTGQTTAKNKGRISNVPKKWPSVNDTSNYKAVLRFHRMKRELLPILFVRLVLSHPDAMTTLMGSVDDEECEAEE